MRQYLAHRLQRAWWQRQPTPLARLLWPLSCLYGTLYTMQARMRRGATGAATPVPVIVVGNLIVGGAGKTPTVIALARALAAAGWRPGVISRGYGRAHHAAGRVGAGANAKEVGDEPALMARLSGAPVWVGTHRAEVVRQLCAAHPEVNVIISDDGLQHAALPRQLEVLVFDERGIGNGMLLPAGPLREPMWITLPPHAQVLYNAAAPSTPLPGSAIERGLGDAVPLSSWLRGDRTGAIALAQLADRRCIAAAGIAVPERFFTMLESASLRITRLPLPDHYAYDHLPWPADAADVVTTEKDAVKLLRWIAPEKPTRIWVVGLDFRLPETFLNWVCAALVAANPHRAP